MKYLIKLSVNSPLLVYLFLIFINFINIFVPNFAYTHNTISLHVLHLTPGYRSR